MLYYSTYRNAELRTNAEKVIRTLLLLDIV